MRKLTTFIGLSFITVLYAACSNYTGKFIGKWSPVNNTVLPTTFVLTIQKSDDQITMVNSRSPDRPIPLTYAEQEEALTGEVEGNAVRLTINSETGNLLFQPDANADAVEFRKQD